MSWLVDDLVWNWGLVASYHEQSKTKLLSSSSGIPTTSLLSNSILDLGEVDVEKRTGEHEYFKNISPTMTPDKVVFKKRVIIYHTHLLHQKFFYTLS